MSLPQHSLVKLSRLPENVYEQKSHTQASQCCNITKVLASHCSHFVGKVNLITFQTNLVVCIRSRFSGFYDMCIKLTFEMSVIHHFRLQCIFCAFSYSFICTLFCVVGSKENYTFPNKLFKIKYDVIKNDNFVVSLDTTKFIRKYFEI